MTRFLAGAIALAATLPSHAQCLPDEHVELVSADAAAEQWFGYRVAGDGTLAVSTALLDGTNGTWAGAAYVHRLDGGAWTAEAKLLASDGAAGDEFGQSVAADGDRVVVGAHKRDDACPGDPDCNSGAAYVFRFDGAAWIEEAKLTAPDADAYDGFGVSVAIRGDLVVVGSYQDGNTGPSAFDGHGSAYVFRYVGGAWTYEAKLMAPAPLSGGHFGFAVAVDGDTALIGAHGHGSAGFASGAGFVYRHDGEAWAYEAQLTASDGASLDQMGKAVALSGDEAILGAMQDDDACGVPGSCNSGAAYVFRRARATWTQEAKLRPADNAAGDLFGIAVGIESGVALVGARGESANGPYAGAAYVFHHDGGAWNEAAILRPDDGAGYDFFGDALFLRGGTGIVGAWRTDGACPGDPDCNSGSTYVFRGLADCDGSGGLDLCEIASGSAPDLNGDGVPDACGPPCDADLDGNGAVGFGDLLTVLASWGSCGGCPADIDADGAVNFNDVLIVLSTWGPC